MRHSIWPQKSSGTERAGVVWLCISSIKMLVSHTVSFLGVSITADLIISRKNSNDHQSSVEWFPPQCTRLKTQTLFPPVFVYDMAVLFLENPQWYLHLPEQAEIGVMSDFTGFFLVFVFFFFFFLSHMNVVVFVCVYKKHILCYTFFFYCTLCIMCVCVCPCLCSVISIRSCHTVLPVDELKMSKTERERKKKDRHQK